MTASSVTPPGGRFRVADPVRRLAGRLRLPGRWLVILPPYVWLLLFFLLPFLIVLKISFSEPMLAQPPYAPMFGWDGIPEFGELKLIITLNLSNYLRLAEDALYSIAYLNSVKIALISTALCLLIGYPMAYGIARAAPAWRGALLMLVILPFWTSFLIRVYAWIGILKQNGTINNLLLDLGLIERPLQLMYTEFSLYLGITYSYLPFMILPLYATLEKLDDALLEAAADLGCRPFKAFLTITLPLSLPGILGGSLLVFIPAVGEFVIPELLGGPQNLMIGKVLWNEFFDNRDWPAAAAVATALLLLLVVPMMVFHHLQGRRQAAES